MSIQSEPALRLAENLFATADQCLLAPYELDIGKLQGVCRLNSSRVFLRRLDIDGIPPGAKTASDSCSGPEQFLRRLIR